MDSISPQREAAAKAREERSKKRGMLEPGSTEEDHDIDGGEEILDNDDQPSVSSRLTMMDGATGASCTDKQVRNLLQPFFDQIKYVRKSFNRQIP